MRRGIEMYNNPIDEYNEVVWILEHNYEYSLTKYEIERYYKVIKAAVYSGYNSFVGLFETFGLLLENGYIDKPTYDEGITDVYLSALQAIDYGSYKTIYDECTE